MTLNVKLGQAYGVGKTAKGNRFIVPITGGTFEGPNIKGEVLEDGAENGAIYNLGGQRVVCPSSGIYISNGKKIIIE